MKRYNLHYRDKKPLIVTNVEYNYLPGNVNKKIYYFKGTLNMKVVEDEVIGSYFLRSKTDVNNSCLLFQYIKSCNQDPRYIYNGINNLPIFSCNYFSENNLNKYSYGVGLLLCYLKYLRFNSRTKNKTTHTELIEDVFSLLNMLITTENLSIDYMTYYSYGQFLNKLTKLLLDINNLDIKDVYNLLVECGAV